jgi:hypothetical protein
VVETQSSLDSFPFIERWGKFNKVFQVRSMIKKVWIKGRNQLIDQSDLVQTTSSSDALDVRTKTTVLKIEF